jgi:hypothetical protein
MSARAHNADRGDMDSDMAISWNMESASLPKARRNVHGARMRRCYHARP